MTPRLRDLLTKLSPSPKSHLLSVSTKFRIARTAELSTAGAAVVFSAGFIGYRRYRRTECHRCSA